MPPGVVYVASCSWVEDDFARCLWDPRSLDAVTLMAAPEDLVTELANVLEVLDATVHAFGLSRLAIEIEQEQSRRGTR